MRKQFFWDTCFNCWYVLYGLWASYVVRDSDNVPHLTVELSKQKQNKNWKPLFKFYETCHTDVIQVWDTTMRLIPKVSKPHRYKWNSTLSSNWLKVMDKNVLKKQFRSKLPKYKLTKRNFLYKLDQNIIILISTHFSLKSNNSKPIFISTQPNTS